MSNEKIDDLKEPKDVAAQTDGIPSAGGSKESPAPQPKETVAPVFDKDPLSDSSQSLGNIGIGFGCVAHPEFDKQYRAVKKTVETTDAKFIASVSAAYSSMTKDGFLNAAVDREGAKFTQNPAVDGEPIPLGGPRVPPPVKGGVTSGINAAVRLVSSRGSGSVYDFCLKDAGFWVTIKPTRSSEVIALVERIQSETLSFGREVFGLIGSATSCYVENIVMEFCVDHVVKTNVIDMEINHSNFQKLLNPLALQELVNGIMLSTHGKGLDYTRQCIDTESGCTGSRKGTIDPSLLQITDERAFSPMAADHLFGKKDSGVTFDEVLAYRSMLNLPVEKTYVLLDPPVSITMSQPSLEKSFSRGYLWVADVAAEAAKSRPKDESMTEGESRVKRFGEASMARQYEAFVTKISYEDGVSGETIATTDLKGIRFQMEALSAEEGFVTSLRDSVDDLLSSTAVSVFGVSEWSCDKCDKPQRLLGDPVGVIVLDMVSSFLQVCFRKWESIRDLADT